MRTHATLFGMPEHTPDHRLGFVFVFVFANYMVGGVRPNIMLVGICHQSLHKRHVLFAEHTLHLLLLFTYPFLLILRQFTVDSNPFHGAVDLLTFDDIQISDIHDIFFFDACVPLPVHVAIGGLPSTTQPFDRMLCQIDSPGLDLLMACCHVRHVHHAEFDLI
jgi:hypothetical protein